MSLSKLETHKVLVIYTGGTIGMTPNDDGKLAPVPGKFEPRIRKDINLHDPDYKLDDPQCLALPPLETGKRILYKIIEYNPLLDSSNMNADNWKDIAKDIEKNYNNFNGFVILHGTDTLTYTASALSFMLENLGKPVIVTGAQIPLYQVRSDSIQNFTTSLICAGLSDIKEVCVAFHHKVFRGNRTVKKNCDAFAAFDSPNYPPLATSGVNIVHNKNLICHPPLTQPFKAHLSMSPNVSLLRITPGISKNQIQASLGSAILGIVLETFGAGNIPSNNEDLLNELKKATDREVIVVNCTQCLAGSVADSYDASSELRKMGVISLKDITLEAAYTKLSYVLSKDTWTFEEKKQMMKANLRGELSFDGSTPTNGYIQ